MANVAPGIITMGLGGSHTNMIIGFPFNLGFIEVIVGSPPVVGSPVLPGSPPVGPGSPPGGSPGTGPGSPAFPPIPVPQPPRRGRHGGGGGARPFDDGKVWPDQTEKKDEQYKTVTIRVTLKGKTTEKVYLVTKHRADAIVKVLKATNSTQKRIKIVVNAMKNKASQIVAKVTNIRNKDD